MIITVGHRYGWPVAQGGSQAIINALAALLGTLGGTIETGVWVRSLGELTPANIVMLDLVPDRVVQLAGELLSRRFRRAYRRWRHGPAAFKVDFAVHGGVPWTSRDCRRAGTVHLGGMFEEIVAAERTTHHGGMPARLFVLVGQQYLADPSRSAGNVHPVYAYAHVPHAYPVMQPRSSSTQSSGSRRVSVPASSPGLTVVVGAAGGELLDQGTDQTAVFGVQPAFHPESPVAALAKPQLTAGWRGCGEFVVRWWPVGIQAGQQALSDDPQPARVEIPRVASQGGVSAIPGRLQNRRGQRTDGFGDHPQLPEPDLTGGRRRRGSRQPRRPRLP
ncbi:MAG TPA: hypothetical protein VF003_05070, partial [Pseudonocardiaceae bacterium]